jgi:hypothetical protein
MRTFYKTLNDFLKRKRLGPARRYLEDGRRTLKWHVDNYDGRHVTVAFAEHDPVAVILEMRDDLPNAENRKTEIVVRRSDLRSTVVEIVEWIDNACLHLGSTSPQPNSRLTAKKIATERRDHGKI